MEDLYSKFCSIKPAEGDDKFFSVEDFTNSLPHKLGCSKEFYPIFFVECSDETNTTNINLKKITVNFNQICNLKDSDDCTISKKYTIILLKSQEGDLQKYFLELVYIVLKKLPTKPTVNGLKHELSKVISLFTVPPVFSKEVVKGLWAELFVIAKSTKPLYLINSWHVSPDDKYDFNDGIDKVEVKATSTVERIHTFALEQLCPNADSKLIVASIIVVPSGQGVNIFDLTDAISSEISDLDAILKLKEVVYQTIGPHLDECSKLRYDVTMATNTCKFIDYQSIPAVPVSTIPPEVSGVHFRSCLKNVPAADLSLTISKLHKAL